MVNKDGQFKTKIPTAYKKKKNISIDGDIKKQCPVCLSKKGTYIEYAKPQTVNEHDGTLYHVGKCSKCKYVHLDPISVEPKEEEQEENV
jgi:C4-type Zn-finger protein